MGVEGLVPRAVIVRGRPLGKWLDQEGSDLTHGSIYKCTHNHRLLREQARSDWRKWVPGYILQGCVLLVALAHLCVYHLPLFLVQNDDTVSHWELSIRLALKLRMHTFSVLY